MLVNVVAEGTGTRGGITGYSVAGKTGTARKPLPEGGYGAPGSYRYIANFAGFVPAEKPELSIIVVIDEPAGDIYGGTVAAPVFADLAQYGLRLFRIPPPLVEQAPAPDTAAAAAAGGRGRGGPRARAGAGHAGDDHDHGARGRPRADQHLGARRRRLTPCASTPCSPRRAAWP